MYHFLILLFGTTSLHAQNTLGFKKELVASNSWMAYVVIVIILVTVLLVLAKKSTKIGFASTQFKTIDTFALAYKTKIYVIKYQEHQFLIAENPNSLAIEVLKHHDS